MSPLPTESKTSMPGVVLYELAGADPELRFSPHCWKTRMALAHKGLEVERVPWRFTEQDRLAFSGQGLVPVLADEGNIISDSWRIALYLEQRYPERPSLFGDAAAIPVASFVNTWSDKALALAVIRVILLDIHRCLHEGDREYFRSSREQRFGMALEDVVADRPTRLAELQKVLQPLRHLLKDQQFISGAAPAYPDYCIFGMFMWARCCSPIELLTTDDPVHGWRERILDAFGGLGRAALMATPTLTDPR
jgi:glutathione S-transferase